MRPIRAFLAGIVAALLAPAAGAAAQGLEVAPVLVEMGAGQMTATLTVGNRSDQPMSVQLRPFAWGQDGDSDSLEPTETLVLSPRITSVGPGETQIFRIVLRRAAERQEGAYRLLLDQLPSPMAGGVRISLRLSIPVFVRPAAQTGAALSWRIRVADGRATLIAVNRGNSRARVVNPRLQGAASPDVVANANPYVLAGATRSWRLGSAARLMPGGTLRLTALSEHGAIDEQVPVGTQ